MNKVFLIISYTVSVLFLNGQNASFVVNGDASDNNITDENGKLKHWFVCQLDGFMDMVDLPINDIDDENWSGWENGDCELVNQMVIESIIKMYFK